MFFGLTNSPAMFQTMMDEIFRVEIDNGQVIVYIDNILIFSKMLHEHHAQVCHVMQIFCENKLYLNLNKCMFNQQETEYLGVIVGNGQVCMDPIKVAGIADWKTPTDKRQVQSFLGFCNFYQRFIQGSLAHSLNSPEMNRGYGVLTNKAPLIESKLLSQLLQFLPSLLTMTHFMLRPMLPSSLSVPFFLSNRMIHGNQLLTSLKCLTRRNIIMRSMIKKCLQS